MDTKNLFKLNGKVAIVTGGYGRVGRHIVKALTDLGCQVIVASTTPSEVNFGEDEKMIEFFKCNVAEKEEVVKLRDMILEKYNKIDILINCVTGNASAPLEEMSLQDWEEALKNGLNSLFLCTQIIGSVMKKQKSGNIINIGSIYGIVAADQRIYGDSGFNSSVVYAAIKSAILNFSRYVAVYWADSGIRCNTLSFGGLEHPTNANEYFQKNYISRTPLKRMMQEDDIKGAIAFLATDASKYYTGQNLIVDGGWTAW